MTRVRARAAVLACLVSSAFLGVAHDGPALSFPRASATIAKRSGGRVALSVEIARTPAQRARGLSGRRTLPARHGMLFVFPRSVRAAFWMKDTRIPLAIAFLDHTGKILRIMEMRPCLGAAAVCPVYDPGVRYRRALEVNGGSFRRWGVRRGDVVRVRAASRRA